MPEALLRESGRKSSECRKTVRCSYIYAILEELATMSVLRRSCTRDTLCTSPGHASTQFTDTEVE